MTALDQVFVTVEPPSIIQKTKRRLKPVVLAVDPPEAIEPLPARFDLLTAEQVQQRPRLQWAVLNAVPLSGVMSIYGPSGSGKSFLTIDLAAALAEGGEWFGHRVKKSCRVVYLALEGAEGIRQRVEAWEKFHERPFPANVKFVFDAFHINDRNNVLHLSAAIDAAGGADVIIADTLNRAAPEMDENSSRDMGMALEGCKELQAMTGALVVLVSHTGKDTSKGLRGHSSLFAALDAAIEVSRSADSREWCVAKSKDGADSAVHRFRLEVVDLGEEDGEPFTSCVVRPDVSDKQKDRPALPAGGNQRIVWDALVPLLLSDGVYGKDGVPSTRPSIDLEAAVTRLRERLPVAPDRRNERTRDAIKGLISRGLLGMDQGRIWIV